MNNKDGEEGGISLLEAVDALTAIADTHWEKSVGELIIPDEELDLKNPLWLFERDQDKARERVKTLFRTVLDHLKLFYQNEYTLATDSTTLERIKSIMVIVGEAAKKIDHFTTLFNQQHLGGATKLSEYRQLQDFYNKKISRRVDESLLGKWLLALTKSAFKEHEEKHTEGMKSLDTRHFFVDLDSVKQDKDYELFFIRKEDGSRFFNPRIIKNIKLISDFGAQLAGFKEKTLFIDQRVFEDRFICEVARQILNKSRTVLEKYMHQLLQDKGEVCSGLLNQALMALLLSASPMRQIGNGSTKSCFQYFADFQSFLRLVLLSREFHMILAYPQEEKTASHQAVLQIVEAFITAIYEGHSAFNELVSYENYLFEEARKEVSEEHMKNARAKGSLASYIGADGIALRKLLKNYPNESIEKILENLEEGEIAEFDPWIQKNIPLKVFNLYERDRKMEWVTAASPTTQENIRQAQVNEEFRVYLRKCHKEGIKLLVLNYQDRTSWKEHARANAIEDLEDSYDGFLTVATLPKETEFYWQEVPYAEDHQTSVFKEHLIEHMIDNYGGLYLPEKVRLIMNKDWFSGMFDAVHRLFFGGRNVLAKEARQQFIDIFYLFLKHKLIEIAHPDRILAICKDGMDVSVASSALFAAFQMVMTKDSIGEAERTFLKEVLFLPSLLNRHRFLMQERFDRFIGALQVLESTKQELGRETFCSLLKDAMGLYIDADSLLCTISL
ncbi:MAG: hypothetical protein ACK5MA_05260 [Parachlamydiaceae bacterium]